MTCGGRSWAGPERGSEILCVLTHGMGSTPPPPQTHASLKRSMSIKILEPESMSRLTLSSFYFDLSQSSKLTPYKTSHHNYMASRKAIIISSIIIMITVTNFIISTIIIIDKLARSSISSLFVNCHKTIILG